MDSFFFRNFIPSNINNILNNKDVAVNDILNEPDVGQECSSGNEKLIEFILSDNNIEEIVNIMLTEPAQDLEDKLRYKLSYSACSVLSSENYQIKNAIISNHIILCKMVNFLEANERLNPLQASFFSKCILSLASTRSQELAEFFCERGILVSILKHVTVAAITDLFMQLTSIYIEKMINKNEEEYKDLWFKMLIDECLISNLIKFITSSENPECNYCSSQLLCDILYSIRTSLDKSFKDLSPYLQQLLTEIEDTTNLILIEMFNTSRWPEGNIPQSVLFGSTQVLIAIIDEHQFQEDYVQPKIELLNFIIDKLKEFNEYLYNPPAQHYVPMESTTGILEVPLGKTRLQISRLISILLMRCQEDKLFEKLTELDTMKILIELFFSYPWNNFLHSDIERSLNVIMNLPFEHPFFKKVIIQGDLIGKITTCLEKYRTIEKSRMRPGYMGYLTNIANSINDKIFQVPDHYKTIFPAVREVWMKCTLEYLKEINNQNSTPLCENSISPRSDMSSPISIEAPSLQNLDQEGFAKYQTQQMTESFAENFGIEGVEFEEEFPFETVSKKINLISIDTAIPTEFPPSITFFEQSCNDQIRPIEFKKEYIREDNLYEEEENEEQDESYKEYYSTEAKEIVINGELRQNCVKIVDISQLSPDSDNTGQEDLCIDDDDYNNIFGVRESVEVSSNEENLNDESELKLNSNIDNGNHFSPFSDATNYAETELKLNDYLGIYSPTNSLSNLNVVLNESILNASQPFLTNSNSQESTLHPVYENSLNSDINLNSNLDADSCIDKQFDSLNLNDNYSSVDAQFKNCNSIKILKEDELYSPADSSVDSITTSDIDSMENIYNSDDKSISDIAENNLQTRHINGFVIEPAKLSNHDVPLERNDHCANDTNWNIVNNNKDITNGLDNLPISISRQLDNSKLDNIFI